MILYSSPLSPFSARVKVSLYQKTLDFKAVKPSTLGGMKSPGFLAVSPMGRIPVLELSSGERIAESDAIVEYLEDKFPRCPLRPIDADQTARCRQITRFSELYVISRLLWGGPTTRRPLAAMMPLANNTAPLPRDKAEIDAESAALICALKAIDRLIDRGGPFALGEELSLADGALLPYLSFVRYAAELLEIGELLDHPLVSSYLDCVVEHSPVLSRSQSELSEAMIERRHQITQVFG